MGKSHIILCAGHGVGDPRASKEANTEVLETIKIADVCAHALARFGIPTTIVPHRLNPKDSTAWVNKRFEKDSSMAIEVHKDVSPDPSDDGISVWHGDGNQAEEAFATLLANQLATAIERPNRGVYPDTTNRHKRLDWANLQVDSVLVECGSIASANTESAHEYGVALSQAIISIFQKNS